MWRRHMRARWEGLGFDSDVFKLFMKMKGGRTRLKLLNALSIPKDRYQLAKELGLDWRAVDQHLVVLSRHFLVTEENAYGKVKMYSLTASGRSMLRLLEDLDRVESGEKPSAESGKATNVIICSIGQSVAGIRHMLLP
jgi:DNA-binding transcriptional ArsR family regulator